MAAVEAALSFGKFGILRKKARAVVRPGLLRGGDGGNF